MTRDAIIVPLKRFDLAKERLRSVESLDVSALAKNLALGVVHHSAPRRVIVLCESSAIASFATDNGAEVFQTDARSLNEAVQGAYEALGQRFDQLIIVHGDLANPEGLGKFRPEPGITIITDRHGRGTNVLVVPTGIEFRFLYGPDSARRHYDEAQRLGVSCHVIRDSIWGVDVDEPEDLDLRPDGV